MRTHELGGSTLQVPNVSFGAWAIGGWYWGGADDEASLAALRAALNAGTTAIDTAPIYGFGRSEELVGRALAGRRAGVVVMTKVGLRWDDARGERFFDTEGPRGQKVSIYRNARPDSLRHEIEQSLRRLAIDTIDLLQVHWPDPTTPVAETMGALLDLRREGKLRAIGVSNFGTELLDEARAALGDVPLASVQSRYSLLARGIERDVLPYAREHGIGVLAYSPLEQGLLTGKVGPERTFPAGDGRAKQPLFSPASRAAVGAALREHVEPIARRHDATVAQVVIACTVAQPGVTSALVGARTAAQARENARAGELELAPAEVQAVCDALASLPLAQSSARPGVLSRIARRFLGRG